MTPKNGLYKRPPVSIGNKNQGREKQELGKIIQLTAGNIGNRIGHFLENQDSPSPEAYRTMEHLTTFDVRDIEKEFLRGADTIALGDVKLDEAQFRELQGKFQRHRYEYALTLWYGSNDLGISAIKSKYALSEIQESNSIHKRITGEALIDEVELSRMSQEINY